MTDDNRRTLVPAIPESDDPSVSAIKELVEVGTGQRGNPLERFIRLRDLRDIGLIDVDGSGRDFIIEPGGIITGGTNTGPLEGDNEDAPDFGQDDLTVPPAPRGVRARGLNLSQIGVSWLAPGYNNHAYAEIFASMADNWPEIEQTFNPLLPIGAENQSDYFMGTAAGTTFLHSGLNSTVPTLELERDVLLIFESGDRAVFRLQSLAGNFVSVGDRVYLSSDGSWSANGQEGTVRLVNDTDMFVEMDAGTAVALEPIPPGVDVVVGLIPEDDDLQAVLQPATVYYWVRFVSTAAIPGPPQSEAGVPGRVMVNPTEVLNILTGRIRSSQLAQDIIGPINFIRGPVTEVDAQGNRVFPTVRDFVNSLGGDLISEYDETLEQVFLGFLGDSGNQPQAVISYTIFPGGIPVRPRASFDVAERLPGSGAGQVLIAEAAPGTILAELSGQKLVVVQEINTGVGWRYIADRLDGASLPGVLFETYDQPGASLRTDDAPAGDFNGVASAAAYLRELAGQATADGAWIESIETLQAAIQDDAGNVLGIEGAKELIGTIANKSLVRLGLEDAALAVWDNLQLELTDPENPLGPPLVVAANEAANLIYANENSISQSITFKAQQNIGGVLFSAGFGLGLEGDPLNAPVSTFAVAADQFAIMSAASHGRVVTNIQTQTGANRYVFTVLNSVFGAVNDGLDVGSRCTLTVPFNSAVSDLRGVTFEVVERGPSGVPQFVIYVRPIDPDTDLPDEQTITPISADLSVGPEHAVFPEQSVPFIVRTDTEDNVPVIGIRGRLIVDGMITATELEVTDLLRANEIWATSITAFGLIKSPLLVGEVITTPLFGGWGVKIAMEDTGFDNRVIEFSKWGNQTQDVPDDPEAIANFSDALQYPQMQGTQPIDTSFWLRASDGSVYVRGNLTVGGNARFWTGHLTQGADHFIQMDQEFPLFIMPRNQAQAIGVSLTEASSITYSQNVINGVRRESLFWANRDGTIGFNTQNGAIFAGDTPLEPPTGAGDIRVLNRLDNGAPTGRGRVFAMCRFQQRVTTFWPDSLVNCQYAMFLGDISKSETGAYFNLGNETIRPSVRSADFPNVNPTASELQFLDRHFVIIRASGPGGFPDPGYATFESWLASHPELIRIDEVNENGPPTGRTLMGRSPEIFNGGAAGADYRLIVAIVERADLDGNLIFGPSGPKVMPVNVRFFSQQVANTIEGAPIPEFVAETPATA